MNQENQEQLASINQQISSEVCANLTKTLAAIRTEILNVQERGNANKAKARLATTAASWLESMQTLLSSIPWPRKLTKDGKVIANILAGHMVGIVFMSLIFIFAGMKFWLGYVAAPISLIFSIFMTALELLVALIQAYVFTLLSAIYIGMATTEHE